MNAKINLPRLARDVRFLSFVLLFAGIISRTWATDQLARNIAAAPGDPAVIAEQPIGRTATAGGHVILSVLLSNAGPFTFQWFTNNHTQPLTNSARVSGATNSVLNIDPAFTTDSGGYSVVVSSSGGSVTSRVASVAVSNLLAFPTQTGSTGVVVLLVGQIGDVYRTELDTNFTGYKTNGYVTNFTGTAIYTYRWPNEPGVFRFRREAVDRILPVLYPSRGGEAPNSLRAYGKLNQVWRFEGSVDLLQWSPSITVTNTNGWFRFHDGPLQTPPIRFYRIAPAP